MNLDDRQKQTVAGWIGEGLKLSEIQNRLNTELGVRMTYMEVRLLVDDLKLLPKDPPPRPDKTLVATNPQAAHPAAGQSRGAAAPSEDDTSPDVPQTGSGKVTVSVDMMARPGTMVSGSVQFSDGQSALWYLDQL